MKYRDIAALIGKNENQVFAFLSRQHIRKIPNYTEMEIYMLQNFPVNICAPFIPHKTFNALKIKKSRICRCTPAN